MSRDAWPLKIPSMTVGRAIWFFLVELKDIQDLKLEKLDFFNTCEFIPYHYLIV